MIKLENGIAKISGPPVLVEAEFCCLVSSMKKTSWRRKDERTF